jgi:hypothetical protein
MMGVPAEGTERLAEILREIFVLSEPNRPNRSKSTAVDDPIEIRVYDESGNESRRKSTRAISKGGEQKAATQSSVTIV